MAIPGSIEARLFYRCAFQRHDDARVLLRADHTTGAVYLAGYGIECILKALVLSGLAPAARAEMLNAFRGARAHDYEWLRTRYLENGGARFDTPRRTPPATHVRHPLPSAWLRRPGDTSPKRQRGRRPWPSRNRRIPRWRFGLISLFRNGEVVMGEESPRFPREITETFTLVNDRSTDMRYLPRTLRAEEAEGFLAAAERIMHWVDGRL